jgi:hypothetical protein
MKGVQAGSRLSDEAVGFVRVRAGIDLVSAAIMGGSSLSNSPMRCSGPKSGTSAPRLLPAWLAPERCISRMLPPEFRPFQSGEAASLGSMPASPSSSFDIWCLVVQKRKAGSV